MDLYWIFTKVYVIWSQCIGASCNGLILFPKWSFNTQKCVFFCGGSEGLQIYMPPKWTVNPIQPSITAVSQFWRNQLTFIVHVHGYWRWKLVNHILRLRFCRCFVFPEVAKPNPAGAQWCTRTHLLCLSCILWGGVHGITLLAVGIEVGGMSKTSNRTLDIGIFWYVHWCFFTRIFVHMYGVQSVFQSHSHLS